MSHAELPKVTLEPVDKANREAVEALAVSDAQRPYLTTPDLAEFLAEDALHPTFTSYAVRGDGEVVGFISLGHKPDEPREAWIPLILIDQRCQGRGYGRATMVAAIDALATDARQFASVGLSCQPKNIVAMRLYANLGFAPTGVVEPNGEVELKLSLRRA